MEAETVERVDLVRCDTCQQPCPLDTCTITLDDEVICEECLERFEARLEVPTCWTGEGWEVI